MKFSIIVPCYNGSRYLKDCLESVISQTYNDWEIILIDDGSVDGSAEIMYEYAQKDARIKAFSQENRGSSAARNRGIKEAGGDYILFLDCDDLYVDKKSLEYIAQIIDKGCIDIVAFQYYEKRKTEHLYKTNNLQYFPQNEENIYTAEKFFNVVLSRGGIYQWYAWLYAFKKELWSEIKFDNKIHICEDMAIIYQIILQAQRIAILNKTLYQYRKEREGQLTSISKGYLQGIVQVCGMNINTVNAMDISDEVKMLLNNNFASSYFMALTLVDYLRREERKDIFKLLDRNCYVMSYRTGKKHSLIRKAVNIWGLHIVARLLFIRMKVRRT